MLNNLLIGQIAEDKLYVEDVFSTFLYYGTAATRIINSGVALDQTAEWSSVVTTNGGTADIGEVITDASGNIYVAGSMRQGPTCGYVAKYNSSFQLQWKKVWGTTRTENGGGRIAVDTSGNVYICGYYYTPSTDQRAFVAKLNSAGVVQWQRQYYQSIAFANAIAVDGNGDVYCTSRVWDGTGDFAALVKINSSGALQWQRFYRQGTNATVGTDIVCDASNNVYAAGRASDGSQNYAWVAKYNSSGVLQWHRKYTRSGYNSLGYVAVDTSGNVILSAYNDLAGNLIKFDSAGNTLWHKQFQSAQGNGVAVDSDGFIYHTGGSGSSANNMWLTKLSSDGNTIAWQRRFNHSTAPAGKIVRVGNGDALFVTANNVFIKLAKSAGSTGNAFYNLIPSSSSSYINGTGTIAGGSATDDVASLTFSTVDVGFADATATDTRYTQSATISTGGLVWTKARNTTWGHYLNDNLRGVTNTLTSSGGGSSGGQSVATTGVTGFLANGHVIGNDNTWNQSGVKYAAWQFKRAAKFFDVVTYTGNGANRTISHSLGATPGCIIVKRTDNTGDWQVYHVGIANTEYLLLNSYNAKATGTTRWNSTSATSSGFTVGTDASVNASGGSYVAYLFAHDTDPNGVIKCGSFTTSTSGVTVDLGWEPQWVMIKTASTADTGWIMLDNMGGWANDTTTNGQCLPLVASQNGSEFDTNYGYPTQNGFYVNNLGNGLQCVYIAIRRGPMRIPTSGLNVFYPRYYGAYTSQSSIYSWPNELFKSDMIIVNKSRPDSTTYPMTMSRLGGRGTINTFDTAAENFRTSGGWNSGTWDGNWYYANEGAYWNDQNYGEDPIAWHFKRAPGFCDVLYYKGNGAASININHNLTVAPELMILRRRDGVSSWIVYAAPIGATKDLLLNSTSAERSGLGNWNDTAPTATQFSTIQNASGANYLWYGFASCPGVSKVGSYTGNGTSQTINCGFAAGARFVLIKRTDATGNWMVWDTGRGIVAGTEQYVTLNTSGVPVTTTDSIDPDASGFIINQDGTSNINVNAAKYIYLAIA